MTASVAPAGGILVVAPDAKDGASLVELLGDRGHIAHAVDDAGAALDELVRRRFEMLVIDADLPGAPGRDLVAAVRAYDVEVPILVLTSNADPWIGSGVVVLGKPLDPEALGKAVLRGKQSRRDTKKIRREVASEAPPSTPEELSVVFERALDAMYVAFQPIVHPERKSVFGYEALMRSKAPGKMSTPPEMLAAAEKLGRLDDLGRRVRSLAAGALSEAPPDSLLFVNLHSADLLDKALYDSSTPLSAVAKRVVLEITERATIEHVDDVPARLSVLRFHGFRIAIDDLGAGYAGLNSFATVEPEFVKLDMSLIRNLHTSPVRRRLVSSVVDACRDLGTSVVAEGIEGEAELRALRDMGCELFQGYFFARPTPSFVPPKEVFR
jgi:EAL domain-containing protein (putative c-di-GMP-specific phosphodiesterase class I)/ActR/RegA family two-component response regulator